MGAVGHVTPILIGESNVSMGILEGRGNFKSGLGDEC
jgi:hypothetical protein